METVSINSKSGMAFLSYTLHETPHGSEFAILHKVELGHSNCVELPLTDWMDIEFYQNLLRETVGLDIYGTELDALVHESEWREVAA
ncbi:hypothetical protein [Psychrobacter pygoscelis]|uniref:hypothetical protein n=1 Tax=Psychrobacter pygoscelis TaxID=2488563 RepID=UPI00103B8627|nr:hypothetical protein [Psychrobacter pygoscelis]